MKSEKSNLVQQGGRWVRVGMLIVTLVGPVVNTLLAWFRQRSQSIEERSDALENAAHDVQSAALERLDELAQTSRQHAAEQVHEFQRQAQQFRSQARQLRKALRKEAKQRRQLNKLTKKLRKAGVDWSQELLKRGENLTEGLVVQGSKLSQDLFERGSKVTQDWSEQGNKVTRRFVKRGSTLGQGLVERGGKVTQDWSERGSQLTQVLMRRGGEIGQDLVERGNQVTAGLARRGSEVTSDIAERSEQFFHPERKRNSTFWTVFGFSIGLFVAAIATYFFVRRRIVQQDTGQDQHIELPRERAWSENGASPNRPAGDIHHIDADGTSVATLQAVGVDAEKKIAAPSQAPADAAFVGVVSTKHYYPLTAAIDAQDVIYFSSEEEAQAEGFTAVK